MGNVKKYSFWVFLILLLFQLPVISFAEETKISVEDLSFNQETRILSGQAIPNADISLTDLVATIQADETGYFEILIPENIERSTLIVMDFINNDTLEIDYDFIRNKELTEKSKEKKNDVKVARTSATNQKTTRNQKKKLIQPTVISSENKEIQTQTNHLLPWSVAFILLIAGLTFGLIFYLKKQTEKKRRRKRKRKKRRRKRRRSPTK